MTNIIPFSIFILIVSGSLVLKPHPQGDETHLAPKDYGFQEICLN